MKSVVLIPFRHESVTNLSLIAQELSHSCQELSAKLQSIAETGNPAVVYELNREQIIRSEKNIQQFDSLFILTATLVLLTGIVVGYQLGEWIKAL